MEQRHKRNGILIDPPTNWKDIEVVFNWLDNNDIEVKIDKLVFQGKDAIAIQERIMNGLVGGVGITEGDPYEIIFGNDQQNPVYKFKGYLDYMDKPRFIGCNEVEVNVKKQEGRDWLNDVADGYSFRYFYETNVIKDSDFERIPYIINYVPDTMQLIVLAISLFMMLKELYEIIKEIANTIAELVNSVTPSVGAGVVMDIGDIIWVVLKILIRIAYAIVLVIAIISLIEEIMEQLMPKQRDHLGMKIITMFQKACSSFGLTFKSDLLSTYYKDWVILPSKSHKGGEPPEDENGVKQKEVGVPSLGDNVDNFGAFIRWALTIFNADWRITNGVFRFERWDFFANDSNYILPINWTDQTRRINVHGFNTEEIVSNYMISWEYDSQDQNTLDNQAGRIFQATVEQNVTNNVKLKNIKNLVEITTGMSMADRKDDLTDIEEFGLSVAKIVDKVSSRFNRPTNYQQKINNRIGSLHLSSHTTSIPKMVVMDSSKLKTNQRSLLSSTNLFDRCHSINMFVPNSEGRHNQWILLDPIKDKICKNDLEKLISSNFGKTADGKKMRIDKLVWVPYSNTATITARINEIYTKNLKIKRISI